MIRRIMQACKLLEPELPIERLRRIALADPQVKAPKPAMLFKASSVHNAKVLPIRKAQGH